MGDPAITIEIPGSPPIHTDLRSIKRTADRLDRDPRQIEAFLPRETGVDKAASVAADQLKSFVERIERLSEERDTVSDDIKEVYAEAKGNGYDTTILRQVIRIRKQDKSEREEMEAVLELYLSALGMGYGRQEG